ncbi:MAG: hypothetical protein ABEJ04_00065 [Halobacteriaceae archaeon]
MDRTVRLVVGAVSTVTGVLQQCVISDLLGLDTDEEREETGRPG